MTAARSIFGNGDKLNQLEQQVRSILDGSPEVALNSKEAFSKILEAGGFMLVDTFVSVLFGHLPTVRET